MAEAARDRAEPLRSVPGCLRPGYRTLLLTAAYCLVAPPTTVLSQDLEVLRVGGEDPDLVIEAGQPPRVRISLQGPSPNLETRVLLVGRRGETVTFEAFPFEFVQAGTANGALAREDIAFDGSADLAPGEAQEYALRVTGLRLGGTYSGRIELRATDDARVLAVLDVRATNSGWVDVDPTELVIPITVGEAATRGITLQSRQPSDTDFEFSSSDLVDTSDSAVWIDRSQVSLQTTDNRTLEPGQPKSFTISVASAPRAGVYEGRVAFAGSGVAKPVRIPIRVVADERLSLSVVDNPLKLVRARGAGFIIARGWVQDVVRVHLDGSLGTPPLLEQFRIRLRGERGGFEITKDHLHPMPGSAEPAGSQPSNAECPPPRTGDADATAARASLVGLCLPLRINLSAIPPDRYEGSILFQFEGAADAVSQPVNLAVRSTPLAALIIIFVGVVLGRLAAFWDSTGSKIHRLLIGYERLLAWYKGLDGKRQLRVLTFNDAWLPALRTQINAEEIQEADGTLVKLKLRRSLIDRIFELDDRIEDLLVKDPTNSILQKAKQDLDSALDVLLDGQDQAAKDAVDKVVDDLQGLNLDARLDHLLLAAGFAGGALEAELRRSDGPAVTGGSDVVSRALYKVGLWLHKVGLWLKKTRLYRGLVWSDNLRSDDLAWIGGALYLVFLAGVGLAGFYEIYVTNQTFGARPVGDYAYAFFWGFASNVVSKKLSDLASGFKPTNS